MPSPYDTDLDRNAANFQPLTPLSFLARAAEVYPDQTAIIHGARSWTYREFYARARRLASALGNAASSAATRSRRCWPIRRRCSKRTTAWRWPARCSTPSIRGLMPAIIAFTLDHGEAKVLLADREYSKVVKDRAFDLQGAAAGGRL